MIEIIQATKEELDKIHELAPIIWKDTYREILSEEQIHFMLDRIYSLAALEAQFSEGHLFALIQEMGDTIGFAGYRPLTEDGLVRIEKLYVHPKYQGKKLGSKLIAFISKFAQHHNLKVLELNVNRNNKAVDFYQRQGFEIIQTIDIPYGPYMLNDYIMQKTLVRD